MSQTPEMRHVVDTVRKEWFHMDQDYRIWSCSCTGDNPQPIELMLTQDESLKHEGELRELDRKIAERRRALGLKPGQPLPDVQIVRPEDVPPEFRK